MFEIKTLRTLAGAAGMIARGAVLQVGKDVPDAIARAWLRAGHAERVTPPQKSKRNRSPGSDGSDTELDTR
ncbi:MAG: hypothetical protein MnENMB40S_13330 [Rhizobiaceae bacterium MnEN-MB40S]|nr:MAG: hypothetical protein MnENMB40S_13330 [Rhizobiaceae bacterium MnEN-MB40S]